MSSIPATPKLTLDELSQLCDEIAALTRAGVPLETALGHRAVDLPKRLSLAVANLSDRLRAGESLESALEQEEAQFPPVFTALVAAGARSGQPSAALERLTATARSLSDLRQAVIAALAYPLTVALLAYGLLAFLSVVALPRMLSSFDAFRAVPPFWMKPFAWLGEQGAWWLVPPLLVAALGCWWWYRSAQGEILAGRGGWTLLWLPPARRMLRDARCATFCDLLALLIEYEVPLPEALRLSAAATADPRLVTSAERLASEIQRGAQPAAWETALRELPPLARIALSVAQSQLQLAERLHGAADQYRQAALERSFWLRTLLPGLMTLLIASGIVLLVVTMVVWPWIQVVRHMIGETVQ